MVLGQEARTKGAWRTKEARVGAWGLGGGRERFQTGCEQYQAVARSLLSGRSLTPWCRDGSVNMQLKG